MHEQRPRQSNPGTSPVLCVDLDGTLVRSDLLAEAVCALVREQPFVLFRFPFWLFKGKAHFKEAVARRVPTDPSVLPYHAAFLAYLKQQRAAGRRLILATAANRRFAEAVARHLGIFDDVLASDARTNLSGARKLALLQNRCAEHGFDYAGNAKVDLPIWENAHAAILVNPNLGVRQAAEHRCNIERVFDDRKGSVLQRYADAIRIYQWLKNLLVFVPLLMAHQFLEPKPLGASLLAFLAFSLAASSLYLCNDLLDLASDRQHPAKRNRPLAAGQVSMRAAISLIPVLLLAAGGVAYFLPAAFQAVLLLYYSTSLAYSVWLKRAVLLDVLVLAGLYTLRIIGGAAATSVNASFWLLAFSMFLFLSLALVKRYAELLVLGEQGTGYSARRGYRPIDLETLADFGTASAYMSVLVLAFYINSDTVTELYAHPQTIWLLCPLVLYLLSRIWILARRKEMPDDPLLFLIRDRRSHWLIALGAGLLWAAT